MDITQCIQKYISMTIVSSMSDVLHIRELINCVLSPSPMYNDALGYIKDRFPCTFSDTVLDDLCEMLTVDINHLLTQELHNVIDYTTYSLLEWLDDTTIVIRVIDEVEF
jgi:hypothetical protein